MKLGYDRISPLTNRFTALDEFDSDTGQLFSFCVESGYHTNVGVWTTGSRIVDEFEQRIPTTYSKYRYISGDADIWYPQVLLDTSNGNVMMCIIENENSSSYKWAVGRGMSASYEDVLGDVNGAFHTKKDVYYQLQQSGSISFSKDDYSSAFAEFVRVSNIKQ